MRLTIRGDGHYGRPEVMAWCEANGVDYILGLPGNAVLGRLLEQAADDIRVRRAEEQLPVVRGSRAAALGPGRVHHVTDEAVENCRADHRDSQPGAHRIRRGLPRGRPVRKPCTLPATRRTVTHGANAPAYAISHQPQTPIIPNQNAVKVRFEELRSELRLRPKLQHGE
jgi:hypothetical protein